MRRVGVIGLGNMGLGIAKNLVAAGFTTYGFDIRQERLAALDAAGGIGLEECAEVGARCETVFVMVLNGEQVRDVLLSPAGVGTAMRTGGTVIVTATVLPSEVRSLEDPLAQRGIRLIDSPVTGGRAGAERGALTLMAAAQSEVLEQNRDALKAISKAIFHVGEEIGQGQTVKAALQALIGCTFVGAFEALVLGSKAGIKGESLFEVLRSSAVGSPLLETCARHVLRREFKDTGSHIATMYKDLGISIRVARDVGATMFATSSAYELFQAGLSRYPDEDNWAVAKFLEEIAGTEVTW